MVATSVPTSFLQALALAFGLAWGSFATVCISRIPDGRSVVTPGSRCDGCGRPIAAWRNIPVLGWMALRGRAACCGARISPRVPIVEALGGGLALLSFRPAVEAGLTGSSLLLAGVSFAAALTALVLTFIDLDQLYLPDGGVLLLAALGLASLPLRGEGLLDALVGGAVGFGVVYVPLIWLYERLRGHPGMGLGDAKLLAAIGLWVGWSMALAILVLAAVQGTLVALCTYVVAGRIAEPEGVVRQRAELEMLAAAGDRDALAALREDPLAEPPGEGLGAARLAFGPFLGLAFLEWLFLEDLLTSWLSGLR